VLAGVGFNFDQVSVDSSRGSTIERAYGAFQEPPLRSPMEKHREVLTLHPFEHQESGFAVREDLEVFVHGSSVSSLC
jgi:hypothetical protein